MPTSCNTHDYDGKLREKWFEMRPVLIDRYLRNCLSFDDTIKEIEEWLEKKYTKAKRIGRARRAIKILTSQRQSNFDSRNDIDVEELLPILWDQVKNKEDIHDTFYEQFCDITGGSCSQGRSTRLFQFLFLFDLPTNAEQENRTTNEHHADDKEATTVNNNSPPTSKQQDESKPRELPISEEELSKEENTEGEKHLPVEESADLGPHSSVEQSANQELQSSVEKTAGEKLQSSVEQSVDHEQQSSVVQQTDEKQQSHVDQTAEKEEHSQTEQDFKQMGQINSPSTE